MLNVKVDEKSQAFMIPVDQHAALWFIMDCLRYRLSVDSPSFLFIEGVFDVLAFVDLCAFLVYPGTWLEWKIGFICQVCHH